MNNVKVIIAALNQKGGVGKTSTAVHLGTTIQELRPELKVVIADCDPQGSASRWLRANLSGIKCHKVAEDKEGRTLKAELNALDADIIILDLPPQVEALSLRAAIYANLILIPIGPSLLDIDASKIPIDVAKEAVEQNPFKKVMLVPVRVRQNTASGRELRDVLLTKGIKVSETVIQMRTAYSDAATAGLGVNRYAPQSPAYFEMESLANEVLEEVGL